MTDHSKHKNSKLPDLIEDLTPHDHLCLIYENRNEWQGTVAPFILSGLKRDEKCIQIVDANTTQEVKTIYEETGISVEEYESKGQLTIIHEKDTYTREGYFVPDLMINLLFEETEKALQKGYYALRIAGEMSWTLRGYSGSERVLEYEARLNKELFSKYPYVSLCMYDRRKFDPKTIKEVVMTHPLLIMGNQVYHNFYYLEPEYHLDPKKEEHEVQYLLNNLEQQRKAWETLRESEEKHRRLFETMTQGVIYQAADGKIISANPAAERILGITLDQMQGKTSMDRRWQMIKEDGTPVPGEEHPAMIALKTGQTVGPVTRGVFHPDKNSHIWLNITAIPLFQPGEEKPYQAYATFEDITERKQAEEALKQVEWMLDTGKSKGFEEIKKLPEQPYGLLTIPDPPGLIREAVGEEMLTEIAADYLSLLETSTAVYEKNGDYAFGIFSSGWCRFLDNASRELCKTDDNNEALQCGKWLCHESCWTETSKKAIETGQPVDNPCHGGLRLYAVPIWANQEVVGAINFGYGDPPSDQDELQEIAEKYQVDVNELAEKARAYESRPPFIIELAKDRLKGSAKLIGAMVESKQNEKRLQETNEALSFYQLAVNSMDDYKIAVVDNNYRYKAVSEQYLEGYDLKRDDIEGWSVADLMGQETFEQAIKPFLDRSFKGEVVTYQDWFEIPTRGQRFTEVSYYPIYGENEQISAVAAITHDITRRKQAEEAVEEEFKLRTALLDNIPNCIALILKKDTREIVASNKAGQETGAVPGKKCFQTCAFRDNPCPFCMAPEMWNSGRLQSTEVKYGGSWYQGIWAPLSDDLYVHYIFDITTRKQAEEAMQKRLNELEKLTEISSTIRTAGTLDEMLTMLIDETLKTLDTDTGAIWLNYPSSDTLHFIRARGWVEKLEEVDFKPDQEQGIIGHVFRTRKPYISEDIAKDPLLKPVAGARIPEGESGIFVPLLIENEPAGVLFVSIKLPRRVDTEEYNLLVLLADMAGTAIHRLNLHEETLRQLHWLEATNAVDIAISSSRDLRLTLDLLLNYIITQTEANAACIHLYDSTSKTLNYTAGRGFRSKKIEEKEFKLGESCPGKAALERQMCKCRIEDVEAAGDEPWASILKAEQYAASTCVPLIAKGEVKGVLSSFHSQPLSKDSSWFNFLEALALQAAIAIDNVSLFEGLQRSNQELEAAYDHTIEGWGQAMELRDHETNGHTRRVADMTVSLARIMGVEEKKLDHIRRGALLHDIGKIGIPDSVLFKPGKLTEEEWKIMRRHPVMAYQMLSSIEYLRPALNIPYYHHERYDGSGYPHGLKGDEIPLEARIFAIIDVYDALTSDRPYRKAWTEEQALTYIREQSGKHFDPQLVDVFLKTIIDNENGDD